MSPSPAPTALIAEDEPLLANALQAELAGIWPELRVLSQASDGVMAVEKAMALKPDVLFFDVRMPGLSGLEAAAELADRWCTEGADAKPFPALVFVTAYDQYAIAAFETQAMDYLLKPVQSARLQKTVSKLRLLLANRTQVALQFENTLAQLRSLMGSAAPPVLAPLKMIQASVGSTIHMLAIADVVYFEAADKYVRVLSSEREYLIRTPLKELLPQLDASVFWQIHRSTVVNSGRIDLVRRDAAGKLSLSLRGRSEKLPVSRLYIHLFKPM